MSCYSYDVVYGQRMTFEEFYLFVYQSKVSYPNKEDLNDSLMNNDFLNFADHLNDYSEEKIPSSVRNLGNTCVLRVYPHDSFNYTRGSFIVFGILLHRIVSKRIDGDANTEFEFHCELNDAKQKWEEVTADLNYLNEPNIYALPESCRCCT